jgi:putative Ca2+/H+ antiporter (TMEM165/GDT1 family)
MAAFIASFLFVLLAEMGDKTQLLAMAFASRFKAWQVLVAVFIATILNHFLAVLTGKFLTTVVPLDLIMFLASFSFIIFGLWTIRGDTLHGEEKRQTRYGPIVTVAIAFFLAEMGDKTQLATISLAVEYQSILWVLMGTTIAMVVADAFGIIIGVVMRKHIPERTVKWGSAIVFMLFGLYGMFNVLSPKIGHAYTAAILLATSACTVAAAYWINRQGSRIPADTTHG